jgi:phage terminase large subunit-like protein
MGLRGPGARVIKRPEQASSAAQPTSSETQPWDAPGLSRAERVIRFVESLPCTSGPLAGTTFRLRPWQRKFVRAVYATDKHGRRKVRTAVLSMGRKNGKTGIASALALAHIAGPEAEERGEVYSAANDRWQAGRIFAEVCAIIERVPWLAERISIRRHSKELEDYGGTGTVYAALSRESGTKHGLSPSCVIYDELGQSEGRDLFDALDTALGARSEPLMLVISTQASRDEMPMSELIDYGLRVQRREIADPTFHMAFHTAPMDADPWSPKTWRLANPALGDIRSREDIERLALRAQRVPSAEGSFRNLILNQRVDASAQFLSAAVWNGCGASVDVERLQGRPCYAALDIGATRDLTALALAFPDDDGAFDILPFCWLPREALRECEDRDKVPYGVWAKQGYLLTMPGATTDPKAVALKVAELHGLYDVKMLAFDRWRVEDFRRELSAIGCEVELEPFGQGFKDMAPAVDLFERLAVERKLRHGGHPVLTMCVGNAKTESDAAGNRKLSKRRSTGRIDALVATVMALGVASRADDGGGWEPMLEVV